MKTVFRQLSLYLAGPLLLAGCVSAPVAPPPSVPEAPFSTAEGASNYHLVMAELALHRELWETAALEYTRAALLVQDAALAERAALVAFELGQDASARQAATHWLALAPAAVDPQRLLLSLDMRHGDLDSAFGHATALVDRLSNDDPGQAFALVSAQILLANDPPNALALMERLTQRYDEIAEAHHSLASLALRNDQLDQALTEARAAVRLAPSWPQANLLLARVLVANNKVSAGLDLARRLAERPDADAALQLEYAVLLAAAGRDEEALPILDKVLADEPKLAPALRAAGLIAMRLGELARAEDYFSTLLTTGRQTFDAFYFMARVADQQAQLPRARRLYTQVRGGEYAVTAQVRAAQLMLQEGSGQQALRHLQRFAEAQPGYAEQMITAQGNLLREMGDEQAALNLYDDALAISPDSEPLIYARAFLYEDMDRVEDALRELRALVKQKPDDATALNALGYTLADRTDRYREAHRYIRRALELDPRNAAIIDSMGWVQYRLGRHQSALAHLREAYDLVQDVEIAAHLGEVLWISGDRDEAMAILEDALASNPDNPVLNATIKRLGE